MTTRLDHVCWGIIGVGDVTERKSGPGLQRAERSSLVAVMRRDGAKAADFARRHGVPRSYDDADALIGDPSKAAKILGWKAETTLEQLCAAMVDADLRRVKNGNGF